MLCCTDEWIPGWYVPFMRYDEVRWGSKYTKEHGTYVLYLYVYGMVWHALEWNGIEYKVKEQSRFIYLHMVLIARYAGRKTKCFWFVRLSAKVYL